MNVSSCLNLRAGPLLRGQPRPYALALADDVIDHRVRQLVCVLNVEGVCSTFASCEGHGLLRCHVPPYVAFDASPEFAGLVNSLLLRDAARESPELHFYWTVSGVFDPSGHLSFRLAPGQCLTGFWLTIRRSLDADFSTLSKWLKHLGKRWRQDPSVSKCRRRDEHEIDRERTP